VHKNFKRIDYPLINLNLSLLLKERISYKSTLLLLLAIPLILSAFTHLWNLVGFPSIHVDEGHYLRRAMLVLQGKGPQEPIDDGYRYPYDHPYFGQIFLASLLKIIGYPDSVIIPNASSSPFTHTQIVHSIQMLYLVPRVLMGVLAVIDTFLIYKISELRYNRKVAFIASVLFAVMPMSWMLRRIYLDTILTPFLLSSILCALYFHYWNTKKATNLSLSLSLKNYVPLLLSGVFLGLAIFTKIPAVAIIPLVGFIIVSTGNKNKKNLKTLGLWLIPVISIPLIWPTYAVLNGQFDIWVQDVWWQANRSDRILASLSSLFQIDPVLLILGFAGAVFAALRKDWFCVIWISSFVVFFASIGWVQYFHWIPLIPVFCIVSARMIEHLSTKLSNRINLQRKLSLQHYHSWPYSTLIIAVALGIFGLASTLSLITTNVNASYFNIDSQIVQHIPANSKVTIIGSHWWIWNNLWVSQYIFHKNFDFIDPHFNSFLKKPVENRNVMFIVDRVFMHDTLSRNPLIIEKANGVNHIERLWVLYRTTYPVAYIIDSAIPTPASQKYNTYYQYPYSSMQVMVQNENRGQGLVQIRTNYGGNT
jgi:hypothetical protein